LQHILSEKVAKCSKKSISLKNLIYKGGDFLVKRKTARTNRKKSIMEESGEYLYGIEKNFMLILGGSFLLISFGMMMFVF